MIWVFFTFKYAWFPFGDGQVSHLEKHKPGMLWGGVVVTTMTDGQHSTFTQ